MKALVRWGATLGIAGSLIFGGIAGIGDLRAVALPQEEVAKKLKLVPVFTLANSKGEFPVIEVKNGSKTTYSVGFFISREYAKNFLDNRIMKENPELARTLQIKALSLADYYNIVQEAKKKKDSTIYALVSVAEQSEAAKTILVASGLKIEQFNGVPLFAPKLKKDYLTIPVPQSKERYVPLYFEKQQVEALLNEFKKAVPQEANDTGIEVLDLYNVIDVLNNSSDPNLTKFILLPSREALEFIRSISPTPAAPKQ